MYRFYFEDSLEVCEWWDHPGNQAGPWRTARAAMEALWASGMVYDGPADACYILMTETQAEALRAHLPIPICSQDQFE